MKIEKDVLNFLKEEKQKLEELSTPSNYKDWDISEDEDLVDALRNNHDFVEGSNFYASILLAMRQVLYEIYGADKYEQHFDGFLTFCEKYKQEKLKDELF